MDVERVQRYGRPFLNAFLADHDDGLELTEEIEAEGAVLVLSSLLRIAVSELFGVPVNLESISRYSRTLSEDIGDNPRRIVLEGVLRAGAGNSWILNGLSEDEVLEATGIVLRRTMRDLEARSFSRATLVDRAVGLAVTQYASESSE
jgi:hypothetical protein